MIIASCGFLVNFSEDEAASTAATTAHKHHKEENQQDHPDAKPDIASNAIHLPLVEYHVVRAGTLTNDAGNITSEPKGLEKI